MLKVSIAMTTYNGEKYLNDQLISLHKQTRKADEVIICDDRSNDGTVDIIKIFIKANKLENIWKVYVNDLNLGHNKNFLACASMTTGDLIFFCDQDDIWYPEKIEKMVAEFEKNNNIKAMSCRISTIDSRGDQNNSLFTRTRMGNGNLEKINILKQIRDNMSSGLTLAVKRDLFEYVKPIILDNNLPFDLPFGLFSSANGSYYILWQPLVYHRIHSNNTSTPKLNLKSRIDDVGFQISGREERIKLLKTFEEISDNKLAEQDRMKLHHAIATLQKDLNNLKQRNVIALFIAIFSCNPMINRQISVINFIVAILGDYSKLKRSE